MLNAGFDDDSGADVCLSTGMLGMVEVVAVYFEVVFVGEVGFRYEHSSICCCFKNSSSSNLC